ncbi:MAG: hypothetical protein DHS80DRAFT_33892 [Piptocephalis tieghemiana]|nr:MAG: hypothetical protein DHS80DRAFT_33892 [Piptocephalis tieghemiana]
MDAVDIFADQLQSPLLGSRVGRAADPAPGSEDNPFADSPLSSSSQAPPSSSSSFPIPDRDIFADDCFGYSESIDARGSRDQHRSLHEKDDPIGDNPFLIQDPMPEERNPMVDSVMDIHTSFSDNDDDDHHHHPPTQPHSSSFSSSPRAPRTPPSSSPLRAPPPARNQPGRWIRHSRTHSQLYRDHQSKIQSDLDRRLNYILFHHSSSSDPATATADSLSPSQIQWIIRSFIDTLLYSTTMASPDSSPSPTPGSPTPPPDLLYMDPDMRSAYCLLLLDSPVFSLPSISSACSCLFDLAEEECETERRSLIYQLLLATSQFHRNVLTQAHDRGMCAHWFRDLLEVDDFWTQRLSVALLWQVLANQDMDSKDLDMIDDAIVNRLLDLVEMHGQEGDGPERPFVRQVLLLLARINAISPTHHQSSAGSQRRLIRILTLRRRRARAFEEHIISLFIHEPSLQARSDLLILFSGLFAQEETGSFFYTNDLCILIDVLIRDLWDLGEEESHVRIQSLMVLALIIEKTQWVGEGMYKVKEISRTLEMLGKDRDPQTSSKARAVEHILEWL